MFIRNENEFIKNEKLFSPCLILFLSFCFFVCRDLSVLCCCCCCCFIYPKSALRYKQLKNVVLCLILSLVFVFLFVLICLLLLFFHLPQIRFRYKQLITGSKSHSLKEFVRQ